MTELPVQIEDIDLKDNEEQKLNVEVKQGGAYKNRQIIYKLKSYY